MSLDRKFLEAQMLYEKKIANLEAKLAESEKQVKHWRDLYNDRDKQFQSVRQRYHLLNKLQSNYDKKDKLHLAYMQCLELVELNEKLEQQLAEKEKEIEIMKQTLIDREETIVFADKTIKGLNLNHNQDKISFAVEQLKKVKAEFVNKVSPVKLSYTEYVQEVFNKLNNQIEELKKEIK